MIGPYEIASEGLPNADAFVVHVVCEIRGHVHVDPPWLTCGGETWRRRSLHVVQSVANAQPRRLDSSVRLHVHRHLFHTGRALCLISSEDYSYGQA